MFQVILVYSFFTRKKVCESKMQNIRRVKQFKKLRTLKSNECVWKMVKRFDLQDDQN